MGMSQSLRRCLGDIYLMYTHAHIAHWNISGSDFTDKHSYLNSLYEELWGAIDATAEHLRTLGVLTPKTLAELVSYSSIAYPDSPVPTSWEQIRSYLLADNQTILTNLNVAFSDAQQANNQGLCNFIADRLEVHAKHQWFLTASV